ncbi:MAG: urease accessory protein UreE [Actinomycetes bacterium]
MALIGSVLGNLSSQEWSQRTQGAELDLLTLDQWEAQRSRIRKTTQAGRQLAISLERGHHLRDGDVLVWDEEASVVVVARIHLKDVMVIELGGLLSETPERLARTCLEIGHAIGNQHWPAVVKGTLVYVPLTVNERVMTSVMNTHAFEGITFGFVPGEEVLPYLAPHEARGLFGGADHDLSTIEHGHAGPVASTDSL